MGLFSGIWNSLFGSASPAEEALPPAADLHAELHSDMMEINPTTGLPMVGGAGGMDVMGNAYGEMPDAIPDISDNSFDSFDPFDSF